MLVLRVPVARFGPGPVHFVRPAFPILLCTFVGRVYLRNESCFVAGAFSALGRRNDIHMHVFNLVYLRC